MFQMSSFVPSSDQGTKLDYGASCNCLSKMNRPRHTGKRRLPEKCAPKPTSNATPHHVMTQQELRAKITQAIVRRNKAKLKGAHHGADAKGAAKAAGPDRGAALGDAEKKEGEKAEDKHDDESSDRGVLWRVRALFRFTFPENRIGLEGISDCRPHHSEPARTRFCLYSNS